MKDAGEKLGLGRKEEGPSTSKAVVEKSGAGAEFYTVERGDTFSAIARDHYGDASKYPILFEANRPMLKDPDLTYPGQVLRIPALES